MVSPGGARLQACMNDSLVSETALAAEVNPYQQPCSCSCPLLRCLAAVSLAFTTFASAILRSRDGSFLAVCLRSSEIANHSPISWHTSLSKTIRSSQAGVRCIVTLRPSLSSMSMNRGAPPLSPSAGDRVGSLTLSSALAPDRQSNRHSARSPPTAAPSPATRPAA